MFTCPSYLLFVVVGKKRGCDLQNKRLFIYEFWCFWVMIFVDEKKLFYGFWMVLATTKVGDEEFQHTTSGAVELVQM